MDHKQFALELAHEAGEIMTRHYGAMHELEYKLRTNFKTQVDDEIDKHIRQRIGEAFPDHNIYSEELEGQENQSEFSWVIDPLDGTLPYAYGINDHFSVCIGLCQGKDPILGIIFAPKRNELYAAEKGQGVTLNGQPIKVSDLDDLNKAMVGLDYGKLDRARILPYQAKLLGPDGVNYTYSHACASVSLGMVAAGKMHAYLALKLEPWDMAAAVVIIREAGGRVTTVDNKEWELGDESIVVAGPSLHSKVLTLIGKD